MHNIRAKARSAAWDQASGQKLNPFSRRNRTAPARPADVESSLARRAHTDPVKSQASRDDDDDRPSSIQNDRTDTTSSAITTGKENDTEVQHVEADSSDVSPRKRSRFHLPFRKREDDVRHESTNKSKRMKFTIATQVKAVLLGSWINVLLGFIPAGFAVYYTNKNPILVFAINFVAMVPSIGLLGYGVQEISLRTGETIGALLNMTVGNATQLISSILLLKNNQIRVLETSLLGNIFATSLLLTGVSFLLGGMFRIEQFFNVSRAQTMSMFLFLAALSLVIPTVSQILNQTTPGETLAQSRGTAVIILISYVLWLVFSLKTHRSMYQEPSKKAPKRHSTPSTLSRALKIDQVVKDVDEEEDEPGPQITLTGAVITVVTFAVLLGFNAEYATGSINGLAEKSGLSQSFIGTVILPWLNFDLTAVVIAMQDKLDDSLSLTLERCMQSALLVVPLVVLVAWGMGRDELTLNFDGFSAAALFGSIIVVAYVVQDGRANWLTGALLLKVYVIIGLASYFNR